MAIRTPATERPVFLIIDNDEDDRHILQIALRRAYTECTCLCADSGIQALHKLRSDGLPDYIFLDLHMPVMSGTDFLTAIKSMARTKDVPVIIYSTSDHPSEIHRTMRMGASAYITKQVSIHQLHSIIGQVLETL